MKLTTMNKQTYDITQYTEIEYLGQTKTNRGFWRWILALLLFWPLLILIFFVGDKCHKMRINGVEVLIDQYQYDRLMARMNSGSL